MNDDEPRCADCRFAAIEPHTIYCTHPSVFDKTGYGQEISIMRATGGDCEGGRLFRPLGQEERSGTDRRQEDRRQHERRYVAPTPWWRANWKGLVGILAGVATITAPIMEHQYRMRALEHQHQLDILRAQTELARERLLKEGK